MYCAQRPFVLAKIKTSIVKAGPVQKTFRQPRSKIPLFTGVHAHADMEHGHRRDGAALGTEHVHMLDVPGNEAIGSDVSIVSARDSEHTEALHPNYLTIYGRFKNVGNSVVNVFREQVQVVRFLFCDEALKVVVIVIWVVTFGGNMQAPVISFFFLELGMSAQQIGTAKSISQAMILLTGPMHGMIMDKFGAYAALNLTISLCGFGCLVQACATSASAVYIAACILGIGSFSLETVALATISRALSPSKRCLAVSSFLLQIRIISLGTRLVYPVWVVLVEAIFNVKDVVLRYRLSMMLCTAPCLIGFVWLLTKFRVFRALERPEARLRRMSSTESLLSESQPGNEASDATDEEQAESKNVPSAEQSSAAAHVGEHGPIERRHSREREQHSEEHSSQSTERKPRITVSFEVAVWRAPSRVFSLHLFASGEKTVPISRL